MSEDGSTLARRQLGKYLRDGREGCGFTLAQAAALIERSGSTLQRIEKGTVAQLREVDLAALCTIYGFDPDHTEAMKVLAAQGNKESWWREYCDLMSANFDFFVGLEASAQRLTTYESELVPGLLQTPAYASVLIRSVYPDDNAEEHARRVQLRMRRQLRITRKHQPATLEVILRESVLRGMVGGPKVMATQLKYLCDVGTRPNINLRILPFSAGFPLGDAVGPFVILEFGTDRHGRELEPPVVFTENFAGDLYLSKPATIQRYHHAYESLRRSAIDADASRALLRRVAKEYT
ncbi:helix-turn-helix domain-containing protein [Nocardia anaemiae]|uniref:helix-turn-helix domain-containing protein n=1 Tax=Nocardia anaemiae TaxID=263910 RepID=UPI0007A4670E|nr:helix-turn-helix transcriptional regulator [Nocardia anaemiae]